MKPFTIILFLLIPLSGIRAAVAMIDVSNLTGSTKDQFANFGQTFTPGVDGTLDGLRLMIASSASSFTVTVWDIDAETGGLRNVLGVKSIVSSKIASSYSWAEVSFMTPIIQKAGQPLAFTIAGGPKFWGPAISSVSVYSGGAFFEYSGSATINSQNRDLTFQTLVTPIPEPSVLWIVACGCLLPLGLRKR